MIKGIWEQERWEGDREEGVQGVRGNWDNIRG